MENSSKRKCQIFAYVYKHDIKRVVELMKNMQLVTILNNQISKDSTSNLTSLNSLDAWEVGGEFSVQWRKCLTVYVKAVELIETSNLVRIRWHIYKSDPPTPEYFLIYSFYQDVVGLYTTFVLEMIHFDEVYYSNEQITELNKERYQMFQNYDKYLTESENEKIQKEAIVINAEIQILWKVISNMKYFRDMVPLLCDVVSYEGQMDIGTIMTFIWNTKNLSSQINVTVKDIKNNINRCELRLECPKVNDIPNQEIIWILEEKAENKTLVEFIHKYKGVVKNSVLKCSSKSKQKILNLLKMKVELAAL